MKKYISPEVRVVDVITPEILAGSIELNRATTISSESDFGAKARGAVIDDEEWN